MRISERGKIMEKLECFVTLSEEPTDEMKFRCRQECRIKIAADIVEKDLIQYIYREKGTDPDTPDFYKIGARIFVVPWKEAENMEPIEPEMEGGGCSWWKVCGECHTNLSGDYNYCPECGRKIAW